MPNTKSRLAILEAAAAPSQHIARARQTGDVRALTDSELETLIITLDAEIGPEQVARINAMSVAELEALANGRTA